MKLQPTKKKSSNIINATTPLYSNIPSKVGGAKTTHLRAEEVKLLEIFFNKFSLKDK